MFVHTFKHEPVEPPRTRNGLSRDDTRKCFYGTDLPTIMFTPKLPLF
ncbi:hypothetical protein HMPREF3213_00589 [Heyndrickxia coagulans]|uniref:Uncharacterized protein n=1 Tax=Heyndrickxia coagulans TaxID=1398 RepID=A0A133L003_HEYCO|nr:hypothetical protein HMPREF3213_00589 [Heyndrickxia coagulans]